MPRNRFKNSRDTPFPGRKRELRLQDVFQIMRVRGLQQAVSVQPDRRHCHFFGNLQRVVVHVLRQEAQRVQQVLHLSEAEVMEITHFERGNGLISSNNNNITVEFKASPLERDLITTDRRELLDLLQRMRQQGV